MQSKMVEPTLATRFKPRFSWDLKQLYHFPFLDLPVYVQ